MRRREVVFGVVGAVLFRPRVLSAQQAVRLPRLAIVNPIARAEELSCGPTYLSFFEELAQLGYEEGRTLAVERWSAEGKPERIPDIAQQVARSKPDVIFAVSARFVQHLKAATADIRVPIVAFTVDPVGYGFAASMARPGGNITGLSSDTGIVLVGKHLELLKELSPQASRIGFLAPRAIFASPYFRALEEAARVRDLPLVQLPLESPITHAEYERVFGIASTETDALLVADLPENFVNREKVADLARAHRLPTVYPSPQYAPSGGLVGYGYDPVEGFRRAAHFVDRILKGANPAEMPFEQPSRLYLVVNLKAAQATGIAVPEAMSARADEVIE
jgi:putative tryptophan/tyrosine transport system substrate-binding protein